MLFRNAISKAKRLLHKINNNSTLQSFKDMVSGRYQKLPKASSFNPFSCRESRFHQSFRELDQIYSQWESEQEENYKMMKKKEPMRENRPTNEDLDRGSFMKFGWATPMQVTEQRLQLQQQRKKIFREDEGCSSQLPRVVEANFRIEQKLKELELMDMANVEHVLDIEEVLHYYSRLTCPFYVEIVNRFFMEMYSEFLPQISGRKNPQFVT